MSESKNDTHAEIIRWISENRYGDPVEINPDTSIIARNLLDSMDLLRLIGFLEDTYDIIIDPELLVPENFETVRHIAGLIERLKQQLNPAQ